MIRPGRANVQTTPPESSPQRALIFVSSLSLRFLLHSFSLQRIPVQRGNSLRAYDIVTALSVFNFVNKRLPGRVICLNSFQRADSKSTYCKKHKITSLYHATVVYGCLWWRQKALKGVQRCSESPSEASSVMTVDHTGSTEILEFSLEAHANYIQSFVQP